MKITKKQLEKIIKEEVDATQNARIINSRILSIIGQVGGRLHGGGQGNPCFLASLMYDQVKEINPQEWKLVTYSTVANILNTVSDHHRNARVHRSGASVRYTDGMCDHNEGPALWSPLLQNWTSRLSREVSQELHGSGLYKITLDNISKSWQ